MNLHRLDLVSLSLFALVARTGSISKGAELAHLAVGAAGIVGVVRLWANTSAVTQFLPADLGSLPRPVRLLLDHLVEAPPKPAKR